jgi:hypothetical protein
VENFNQLFRSLARESRVKECFCVGDECSSSIIKAHSVQNNRILRQIAEEGYVIQLKPKDIDGNFAIKSEEIGKKIATVSTNFCGFHDTKIFLPIELKDYQKNNKEQEFLFAYRAFAREYHVKREATNLLSNAKKLPKVDENYLDLALRGSSLTLQQMEKEKIWWNNALRNLDFDKIGTCVIEFYGHYQIAASSAFAVEYDLQRNQINDFSNLTKDLKFTFLSVFPQGNKTFVLLGFYRKDKKLFSFLNSQIKKRNISEQKIIISNLLLSHVENLVLSPRVWNKLLEEQQDFVRQMFLTTVDSFENNLSNLKNVNLFI